MVCDVCGKNQATVHLTEIVDEQMNELHLCEECARQKSIQMEQQFGLSDLLAGLAEFEKPEDADKEGVRLKCPSCKLTYADFKKIGRLGCGECYTAFKRHLGPLLKRIHGTAQHVGKSSAKVVAAAAAAAAAPKETIDVQELRAQLQKAIESEAFEEAARLRDKIKELEKRGQNET
jgi:protein arginine kinase activator